MNVHRPSQDHLPSQACPPPLRPLPSPSSIDHQRTHIQSPYRLPAALPVTSSSNSSSSSLYPPSYNSLQPVVYPSPYCSPNHLPPASSYLPDLPLTPHSASAHAGPVGSPVCVDSSLPPLPSPPFSPFPALPPLSPHPPPLPASPFVRGQIYHANAWPDQQQTPSPVVRQTQARALPVIPFEHRLHSRHRPRPHPPPPSASFQEFSAEPSTSARFQQDSLSSRPEQLDESSQSTEEDLDLARALKRSLTLSWKVSPFAQEHKDLQASASARDDRTSQTSSLAEEHRQPQLPPDLSIRSVVASSGRPSSRSALASSMPSLYHRRHRPPPLPVRPGLSLSHSEPSRVENRQPLVSPPPLPPIRDASIAQPADGSIRSTNPPVRSASAPVPVRTPTLGWARTIFSSSHRSDAARMDTPSLSSPSPVAEQARPILEIDADTIDGEHRGPALDGPIRRMEAHREEEPGRLIYGETTISPPTLSPLHDFTQIPVISIPTAQTGALYIIAQTYADLVEELFSIGHVVLEGSTDWAFALQVVSLQPDDGVNGKSYSGLDGTDSESEQESAIILWIQDKAKPGEQKTRLIPVDRSLESSSRKTRQRKRLTILRRSKTDQLFPSSSASASPLSMLSAPSSSPSSPSTLPLTASSISSPLLPVPSGSMESSARLILQLPGFLPPDRPSVKSTLIPLPNAQTEIENLTGLVDHLISLIEPWGDSSNQSAVRTGPARIPLWRLWTEGEHARFLWMISQPRQRSSHSSATTPMTSKPGDRSAFHAEFETGVKSGRLDSYPGDQADRHRRWRVKTWLGKSKPKDGTGVGDRPHRAQVVQERDVLDPAGFITPFSFTFDRSLSEP